MKQIEFLQLKKVQHLLKDFQKRCPMRKSISSTDEQLKIASLGELFEFEEEKLEIKEITLENEIKIFLKNYLSQFDLTLRNSHNTEENITLLHIGELQIILNEKSFINVLNKFLKQENELNKIAMLSTLLDIIGFEKLTGNHRSW